MKLEKALLNNFEALDELRAGFIGEEHVSISLHVTLQVVNLTNADCDNVYTDDRTFCLYSTWQLCSSCFITFKSQTVSRMETEEESKQITQSLLWLSLMHGTLISMLSYNDPHTSSFGTDGSSFPLTLNIEYLKCNPSFLSTKCVLTELFSWVSVKTHI